MNIFDKANVQPKEVSERAARAAAAVLAMSKQLEEKREQELAEAKQTVAEKNNLVESTQREIRVTKDLMERKQVMAELLSPITGEKRALMNQLLVQHLL